MKRQKITPNPAISSVSVARRHPDPVIAEMMRRNERILAEAMARQIEPPPPQPHRDPQPMATLHQIPDPLAGIGWDSALELWNRIQTPVMFAVLWRKSMSDDPVMEAIASLPLMLLMAAFIAGAFIAGLVIGLVL